MWSNPQETSDLVTFTEEILNGKLHFCTVSIIICRTQNMKWTSSPFLLLPLSLQKQPFTDVLRNRCSQPVLESLFNKVSDLKAFKFIKKRLQHKCFPVNIAKFSRAKFLKNSSGGHFCLYKKMARWTNFETCFDTNYFLIPFWARR